MAKNKSFETSVARLNDIVNAMSSNSSSLDQSLALFDEGIKLIKDCRNQLDCAEQMVKKLISEGGDDILQPVANNGELYQVRSEASVQQMQNINTRNVNNDITGEFDPNKSY